MLKKEILSKICQGVGTINLNLFFIFLPLEESESIQLLNIALIRLASYNML